MQLDTAQRPYCVTKYSWRSQIAEEPPEGSSALRLCLLPSSSQQTDYNDEVTL